MRALLAVFGLVILLVVAAALGGEWLAAWPGVSGGVAAIASSPQLMGAGLALAAVGVTIVNLSEPGSDTHTVGGIILMALVLLLVVFELVF